MSRDSDLRELWMKLVNMRMQLGRKAYDDNIAADVAKATYLFLDLTITYVGDMCRQGANDE